MDNEEKVENGKAKKSIFGLTKQLEHRLINPASLRKEDKKKCADLFKSRGYSNIDIAEILEVDEKTVQRYIKDQREENALAITSNFQKQQIEEVIRHWHAQYYRLLKLSYSEGMTTNEVMKAIYLAHQVEKDGVELLERLGYLTKETAEKDIKIALEREKKEEEENEKIRKKSVPEEILDQLDIAQTKKIKEVLDRRADESYKETMKMAEDFMAENEKKRLAGGGEGSPSS